MINRPTKDELRRLYVDQGLAAQAIADRYGVAKISALRWLRAAGIERRPSGGLARRGVTPPTADELHRMVHVDHMSYRSIGAIYGVDQSAVAYWLDKHEITRPTVWGTRRKGREPRIPSVDELRSRLASGESLTSIAADAGVSNGTIRRVTHAAGIPTARDGWDGGRRIACLDGHEARSLYEQRVDDWLYQHGLSHETEPAYPWDRRYRADFLVGEVYVEVWGVSENAAYQARKKMKQDRCRGEGLRLIEINWWQFANGRRWWRPLEALLSQPAQPDLFHS